MTATTSKPETFVPDQGWKAAFFMCFAALTEIGLSAAMVAQAAGSYRDAAIWTLVVVRKHTP